jgi:hypothetical protein
MLPDSRLESDSITRFSRQHVEQGTEIAKNSSNALKETMTRAGHAIIVEITAPVSKDEK